MHFLPILIIAFSSASAQTGAGKLLADGLKNALVGLAPVPENDKAEILAATAKLLSKHITLRADGTASAYYTMSGRLPIEWRKFTVNRILAQSVSEADRLNGITKRYLVAFGSEAHRRWDNKTNTWGQWRPNGTVTFPAAVSFEGKDGAWHPRESAQLKFYVPGPGESVIRPERTDKDTGLPPGITRGK